MASRRDCSRVAPSGAWARHTSAMACTPMVQTSNSNSKCEQGNVVWGVLGRLCVH